MSLKANLDLAINRADLAKFPIHKENQWADENQPYL